MSQNTDQHSYEEIRGAIIDIITRPTGAPQQWMGLLTALADELELRDNGMEPRQSSSFGSNLSASDAELARDAFWDLFRQGMITLGLDRSNDQWPWFRLSHLGKSDLLNQNPLRFHDVKSYLDLVRGQVPEISTQAQGYLAEAIGAFYADLPLSACVMLGVAAETEFLRVVDAAAANPKHGSRFNSAQKAVFVGTKVAKFRAALDVILADLPKESTENLEILWAIHSIIRAARNDAGHPVTTKVTRQEVYIYLQLFVNWARQATLLRKAVTELA